MTRSETASVARRGMMQGDAMLSGNDYSFGTSASSTSSVGVQLRRIPLDATWPVAPDLTEQRVLDDWLPQRRDDRRRLQDEIDAVDSQMLLLDRDGVVTAVNRAWRLSAGMQQLAHPHHGLGVNYLSLCHIAAAQGCRDAAQTAEGIDAVMEGRWRSFFYKYSWTCEHERRLYLLRAWRFNEGPTAYVAVTHQLLESHAISADERSRYDQRRATIES